MNVEIRTVAAVVMQAPCVLKRRRLAIFAVFISLFLVPVCSLCDSNNVTVPKPEVKYLLNKNVTVTWTADEQFHNYSANVCCQKRKGKYEAHCDIVNCPNFARIDYCHVEQNYLQLKRYSCSFMPKLYMIYDIFLTAEVNGCPVRGANKSIKPALYVAHPPELEKLFVLSNRDSLEAKWYQPPSGKFKLCYFPTCHEMQGLKRIRKVSDGHHAMTDKLTIRIWFTGSSHAFKSYQCCIRVRICGPEYRIFSKELCNMTKTPEAVPSEAPTMLCGVKKKCPEVVEKNFRNVTILWELPDKSTWYGDSIHLVMSLREAGATADRKFRVNGTETQYTLTGLRRDVEYHVSVRMCTSVGCGSISTSILLSSNIAVVQKDGPISTISLAIISGSAIAFMLLALVSCFIWDTRRNKTRSPIGDLPTLQEPVLQTPHSAWSGDSVATSICVNTADYDFLCSEPIHKRRSPCIPDTLSEENPGCESDTSSLDSFTDGCTSPLLRADNRRCDPPAKRVTVTYLMARPHPTTVSHLNSVDSESDPEFV